MSHYFRLFAAALLLGGCGKKLDGVTGWAASQTNTCVITGGKIVCWGSDFGKSSAVPLAGVEDAVEIANDHDTFYWRTGAGAVYAFSSNFINLDTKIDPRRGKVAIIPIVASGACALGAGGDYFVAAGKTSERRRFGLAPVPPALPKVIHVDTNDLGRRPPTRARPLGFGYLRDGELLMPDQSPLAGGPFVDRTGVNSQTHFVSDGTGAVFAFPDRFARDSALREIPELKGATSVVDTGDLRCAVFAGELRCSGNRRALGGATADGEATWKLVPLPFDEPIREVGVGIGWILGGYPGAFTRTEPKATRIETYGFVVAITTSGAVYQWGDSDYGALNGKEGFVKEPMRVKLRRF
jgi:hypothetical protein